MTTRVFNRTFERSTSQLKIARIQEALKTGEKTSYEIAEMIHADRKWVTTYLKHMVELELIHLSGYKRREFSELYTRNIRVYKLGKGKQAKKPAPFSPTEITRRQRNRLSDHQLDLRNAKRRAKRFNVSNKQSELAHFFGAISC